MKKVLLVAMADSIHTARWLEQFKGEPIQFVLFPSSPHRRVHPKIREMLASDEGVNLRIYGLLRRLALPMWAIDRFIDNRLRGVLLRQLIRREKPDILHAMEFQHGAYLVIHGFDKLVIRPYFIATNWGSDIYWFQRFPRHERKIQEVLKLANAYSAECQRDHELAKQHGFVGLHLPVFPNAGGFSDQHLKQAALFPRPSTRKVIAIKGYTGFVGRADIALRAIELAADHLGGFEIAVFSSDMKSRHISRGVLKRTGLKFKTYRRHELSHVEMLELFARSRIYIGVSESDAISTSMLEAMSCGAFPIQTDTSCADEWIAPGETGFLVSPNDTEAISRALLVALTDDDLVDSATVTNRATANARLSSDQIRQITNYFYD